MAKCDFLLKEISQAFANADEEMGRLLTEASVPGLKEIARQLVLLQWRSRDTFQDFGEFYTIRLLLDEQSALASYFIDIFVDLDWMLSLLHYYVSSIWVQSLIPLVRPAAHTCRLLYAAHRMLPKQDNVGSGSEEFKRAGRIGRMFSSNKLHCRMRQLGFVNLDQPGETLVSLKEELGRGNFGTVYKGVFEADHAEEKNEKMIIGEPVAVKMFSNGERSESGISFGTQLLHSMKEVGRLLSIGDKHEPGASFGSQLLQSMGEVSLSTDLQLLPHVDGEMVKNAQLATELSRLVSVRHPNIVTPRGYIGKRPQGESGLVMELMDESLYELLQKVKGGAVPPLTEHDMLDLMLEIAKGMRFLHECNVMHRDLKPGNVLLRYANDHKRSEVKLADFGVTKLYGFASGGHSAAPVGSYCYMAPELIRGNSSQLNMQVYEEKVDVFSYGTTYFNILIGDPNAMAFVNPDALLSASSCKGFYEAVKTGRWKQWVQGINKNFNYMVTLVARCWETDPRKRPTFATICLLLQHSFQCLVQQSSMISFSFYESLPLFSKSDHIGNLQKLAFSLNGTYFQRCKSILGWIQQGHPTVGLDVIQGILREFDDASKHPPISRKVDASDFVKDSRMYLKTQKSVYAKRLSSAWPKMVIKKPTGSEKRVDYKIPPSKNGLIDNCFKTSDPLLLIKGLVSHLIVKFYYKEGLYAIVGNFPVDQNFNFRNDDAHSDLHVDASLVPLLVGFWSLKTHFGPYSWDFGA